MLDCETLYLLSPYPVMAVAASANAWYGWVAPKNEVPDRLIPLGHPDTLRLIVAHNASYDRARISEEYRFLPTASQFIDTLSLHCAVGGLSTQQRALWISHQRDVAGGVAAHVDDWKAHASLNSITHVAKLHLGLQVDKSSRDEFASGTVESINEPKMFQKLMSYCATDVKVTHDLFRVLLPKVKF